MRANAPRVRRILGGSIPSYQPAKLLLNGGVGRIGLKGPFHVPYGGVQIAFILADDRHTNVGNEVVGNGGEHALEDVCRITVALGFQIGLSQ
jgi:hypothetical protein